MHVQEPNTHVSQSTIHTGKVAEPSEVVSMHEDDCVQKCRQNVQEAYAQAARAASAQDTRARAVRHVQSAHALDALDTHMHKTQKTVLLVAALGIAVFILYQVLRYAHVLG